MADYERLITYGLAAIAAVWYVYRTQYLPWRLKQNEQLFNHTYETSDKKLLAEIKTSDDSREYEQSTNTGALNQVIELNQNLVKFLIGLYDKMLVTLGQLPRLMGDVKTQMEISNRDRVRIDEILADIDQELHTIKELLRAELSRRNIESDE